MCKKCVANKVAIGRCHVPSARPFHFRYIFRVIVKMKLTMVALSDAREANKALLSLLKVSVARLDITSLMHIMF